MANADAFRPIIVAYRNAAPVRLGDVATVVDSAENTKLSSWMNTTPAILINVQRQPGANVISVVDSIKEMLPQIIAGARAELAVKPGSSNDRLVADRIAEWQKAQADKEGIFDFIQFINFLLLGVLLVAAIPTGGASLVPAGAVAPAHRRGPRHASRPLREGDLRIR